MHPIQGHDHFYYISNGIKSWANRHGKSGREDEGEDVLIVKSGTNFYDLSELNLVLEDTAKGSVRRKVIRDIKGAHHFLSMSRQGFDPICSCFL